MQADLQLEVRRALIAGYGPDVLRKRLEARGFQNVQTEAQTAVSRFNNLLTFENAAITGTRTFKYFGPVSAITRPFCRAHAGQIFTLEEIEKMDNGQGLSVRESCGGYNCRHYWIPASDLTPGPSPERRGEVRIGKQMFLMNDDQKQALFARERSLWIQTPEASAGKPASWFLTAKPLAIAHDGFNEKITNQLSDGSWAPIFRGKGKNNFDHHLEKRLAEGTVRSADDYRRIMRDLMNNNDANVFEDPGARDGKLRYIIYNPNTKWMLRLDARGLIDTAHPKQFTKTKLRKLRARGTLADFLGRF